MTSRKLLNNIWIRRQQCPCGDWKCFIKNEGDDQVTHGKNETTLVSQYLDVVITPYVGQIFKTDGEAFEHYSKFARKNGFSIRKARSTESQNLGVYRRDFVCYRSGFNQPRKKANVEHPRDRKSVRCGCDAKLYLTKEIVDGVAQWYVSQFSNVHNHELLEDDQVRLLPAYRKIQEADQERILLLSKAGFPVNRIVKVLELEKGVQPGHLPFIEKDVRNFVRTCKKTVQENDVLLTEKRDNDMFELLDACKATSQKDEGFVYSFTADENGKVENIAWTYSQSVHAFSVFGDVVTFDTTYHSITYNMTLGVWFGIDNNGRPIFLGCVLLQDETPRSLCWAIQVFIQFMRGRRPQTIVTDMDIGLKDAISSELPNSKHVMCVWHILCKLSSWFSMPLSLQYAAFKSEFELLYHLEDVEDFEQQWNNMVSRYGGLCSDKHIALLFSYRAFWSFAYIKGSFLARALTSEYSKLVDTFLKSILSQQSCLQIFFEQVGAAANIVHQNKDKLLYMPIKTCSPLEVHARGILTTYSFSFLQHEIVLSMEYAVTEMANGTYLVRHYKKLEGEYFVICIPEDVHIHCSCKEFEHSGSLCRHCLRVLVVKNYFQIPDRYFPIRWRLESSLVHPNEQIDQGSSNEYSQAFHSLTEALFSESLISKDRCAYVQRELTQLRDHVRDMPVHDEKLSKANIQLSHGVVLLFCFIVIHEYLFSLKNCAFARISGRIIKSMLLYSLIAVAESRSWLGSNLAA